MMLDRCRGALYGLAVGDALGAEVEFRARGSFAPVVDYRDGGPHGLAPGEWTDDTSMALALAAGLSRSPDDLDDQAARYVAWWRRGEYSVNGRCFDIGSTVRGALARFESTGDARTSGDASEHASGNGSIMRLAPVAIHQAMLAGDHDTLLRADRLDELERVAAESSRPTHPSDQCISACRYLGLLLSGLIAGVPREEVLATDWSPLERIRTRSPLHPLIDAIALGSFREKTESQVRGSGWVVESLEAALWAFHRADDFASAVLAAVNLGLDADTTGAVCGQLAGACWGESGIPASWLDRLARREMIERALAGLGAAR
ncbi:MAG: ADP-ribosylglycohydrolase family protein [Isosphaeraceae bacterium]|nr:ADP-ribosylglycohydrolase family protein [Isosphaeraceae bacterium]